MAKGEFFHEVRGGKYCFGVRSDSKLPAPNSPQSLRARYDIAQTNGDNERQWQGADNLDADAANSPGVRQIARNRSRHETQNNPTLTGIVRTMRDYEVGAGPTLHVDHDDEDYEADVEARWSEWCQATSLVAKHEQMVFGRVVDGESFARLGFNPNLDNEVKLDFQPFECDRCYTLWLPYLTPYRIDGVWFDTWGNPTYYDILQYHPGGVFPMPTWKFDTTPAQFILHLFRPERANQHRGMPELLSSTDLFADRRRFRKATIGAAESAANVAGFLETDQPADDGSYGPSEFSSTSFPRNSLIVAPNQYKLSQVDAKHPSQTYEAFSRETLGEAARPASMALNVAKCDSSNYNFAGGRLDIITSWKAVEANQRNNTHRVTNRIFKAWYAEARLVFKTNGRRWSEIDGGQIPAHAFLWVGMPYSDPEAEQNADEAAISTGLKGIQEIYGRRGKDWKVERRKNARALGMSDAEYTQWILDNLTTNKGGDQTADNKPDAPAKETPEAIKAKFARTFPGLAQRLNGHLNPQIPKSPNSIRASAGSPFVEVPDIRQDTNYRCGAAAAMCAGRYFGVGPETLDDWAEQLGTNAARSTSPAAIVSYLTSLGLDVKAREGMTVDDLAAATAAGKPVICCAQDYVSKDGSDRPDDAEWDYGHWLTCIGVLGARPYRYLVFQDSSIQNMEREPGGDVDPAEADDSQVLEAPGRVLVHESRWLPAWHDEAEKGELYDHYGIIVGLSESATPAAALAEAAR